MEKVIPGKTIILNTCLNTTFIASECDIDILNKEKYHGKFEWAGELSVGVNCKSGLVDFLDWIHNNWYTPIGNDGWRKLDVENIEYNLPIPEINMFTSEQLVIKYLNGEGES